MTCPRCSDTERQREAGLDGDVRTYECQVCGLRYTPEPPAKSPDETRREALVLAAAGLSLRLIGERLGVSPRSVGHWVRRAREGAIDNLADDTASPRRRRPTIDDVAFEAGVSPSTISNFLTGKGRMSEATRSRIQTAMEKLHFTPNSLVRAIRERRTDIIGVLTFGLAGLDDLVGGSITPPMLQGLIDRADRLDKELLIYTGWPARRDRYSNLTFLNGHVDGLVWMAPPIGEPMLERLAFAGLPVVALLTRHVPDGVGYVNADNIGGTRLLVDHLVGLGHRRIALVCRPETSNMLDRRDGYRESLASAGITHDPAIAAEDGWEWTDYEPALERWLAMDNPPTAIMTSDDGLARDAIDAVRSRGLRVPEDVAVTGFNGVPAITDAFANITTIRQPFREAADLALDRLVALIEGAPVDECRLTLPVELIVSGSTVPSR